MKTKKASITFEFESQENGSVSIKVKKFKNINMGHINVLKRFISSKEHELCQKQKKQN